MATYGGFIGWGVINHYPSVPEDELVPFNTWNPHWYQYMLFL